MPTIEDYSSVLGQKENAKLNTPSSVGLSASIAKQSIRTVNVSKGDSLAKDLSKISSAISAGVNAKHESDIRTAELVAVDHNTQLIQEKNLLDSDNEISALEKQRRYLAKANELTSSTKTFDGDEDKQRVYNRLFVENYKRVGSTAMKTWLAEDQKANIANINNAGMEYLKYTGKDASLGNFKAIVQGNIDLGIISEAGVETTFAKNKTASLQADIDDKGTEWYKLSLLDESRNVKGAYRVNENKLDYLIKDVYFDVIGEDNEEVRIEIADMKDKLRVKATTLANSINSQNIKLNNDYANDLYSKLMSRVNEANEFYTDFGDLSKYNALGQQGMVMLEDLMTNSDITQDKKENIRVSLNRYEDRVGMEIWAKEYITGNDMIAIKGAISMGDPSQNISKSEARAVFTGKFNQQFEGMMSQVDFTKPESSQQVRSIATKFFAIEDQTGIKLPALDSYLTSMPDDTVGYKTMDEYNIMIGIAEAKLSKSPEKLKNNQMVNSLRTYYNELKKDDKLKDTEKVSKMTQLKKSIASSLRFQRNEAQYISAWTKKMDDISTGTFFLSPSSIFGSSKYNNFKTNDSVTSYLMNNYANTVGGGYLTGDDSEIGSYIDNNSMILGGFTDNMTGKPQLVPIIGGREKGDIRDAIWQVMKENKISNLDDLIINVGVGSDAKGNKVDTYQIISPTGATIETLDGKGLADKAADWDLENTNEPTKKRSYR